MNFDSPINMATLSSTNPKENISNMNHYEALSKETLQARLKENKSRFQNLIAMSKKCLERGQYNYAAGWAEIAAYHATWNHNGLFVSYELEKILWKISKQTVHAEDRASTATTSNINKVLHITSMVSGLAGLQNLLRRWIELDRGRCHSVAVSQPSMNLAPEGLKDLVASSGGSIEFIGDTYGGIVPRAQRIRNLAMEADLIVLHLQTEDVAPIIALSQKAGLPPAILVNHADHAFWVGAAAIDFVVNLRRSGLLLCQERRGIDPARLALLPTPLEPTTRTLSREQAKAILGVPSDSVVLLSVARAPKYVTKSGVTFPFVHVPILQKYRNCFLLVVGPEHDKEWEHASQKTDGRIKAFGNRSDTALFFQAADIYVDAFPMVSVTSLLEAGSFGLPLVSRAPYATKPGVWGADAPGLDQYLISCCNSNDYISQLCRLVENADIRNALGIKTQERIKQIHVGENWRESLEALYVSIRQTCLRADISFPTDQRIYSELDLLQPELLKAQQKIEEVIYHYRKALPLNWFNLKSRIKLLLLRPRRMIPGFLRAVIKKSLRNLGLARFY